MTIINAVAKQRNAASLPLDVATVVIASLLLAISAKISIPFYPVPMTMQTLVVVGIGLALGPVRGVTAILLYLFEGAVGLPVFAGAASKGIGFGYLLGPTGGYLVGFLLAAALAGWLAKRGWDRSPVTAMAAALLSGAIIYAPGLLWLSMVIGFDKPVLQFGLYPFILGDIVKAILAALIFPMAWKVLKAKAGH
jgi:biotin transport system substrate-specific component